MFPELIVLSTYIVVGYTLEILHNVSQKIIPKQYKSKNTKLYMARKESDGTKFSKKSKRKENQKRNIYSQKSVRLKASVMEKRKQKNDV